MSLNDCEESAKASQGVRPRSWSRKGGCGGHLFKQASRRTIQGQTVRQPNENPAPPAMLDLTFSCISSPCSSTHHQLSERLPGPAALKATVLNNPAAGLTRTAPIVHKPRSHCAFELSIPGPDSCPSIRETSTQMREQGCLSPSVPSKNSRISTNGLDFLPESANALPQEAWSTVAS